MSVIYFKYQAFDNQGKIKAGQINAESQKDAIRILRRKKLTPIKIEQSKRGGRVNRRGKISNTDLLDFTNGLCTLVEALSLIHI